MARSRLGLLVDDSNNKEDNVLMMTDDVEAAAEPKTGSNLSPESEDFAEAHVEVPWQRKRLYCTVEDTVHFVPQCLLLCVEPKESEDFV